MKKKLPVQGVWLIRLRPTSNMKKIARSSRLVDSFQTHIKYEKNCPFKQAGWFVSDPHQIWKKLPVQAAWLIRFRPTSNMIKIYNSWSISNLFLFFAEFNFNTSYSSTAGKHREQTHIDVQTDSINIRAPTVANCRHKTNTTLNHCSISAMMLTSLKYWRHT